MKKILSIFVLFCFVASVSFAVNVKGYFRSDGTYVSPYVRSAPNTTVRDNYDYKGNINPYTGEEGTKKYLNNPSSEYYEGTYNPTNTPNIINATKPANQSIISSDKYNTEIITATCFGVIVGVVIGYIVGKTYK